MAANRRQLLAGAAIGMASSLLGASARAQAVRVFPPLAPALQHAAGRPNRLLSGAWEVIVDPMKVGAISPFEGFPPVAFERATPWRDDLVLQEWAFDPAVTLRVPGDWNTQSERLFFYEGDVWYAHKLTLAPDAEKRQLLVFEAVANLAEVWVNGLSAGRHEGGFTPFTLDVTTFVKLGENVITVRVNNELTPQTVPTRFTDWHNYGGITRAVRFIEVPQIHIRDWGVKLINLARRDVQIDVVLAGAGAGIGVRVTLGKNGQTISGQTDETGTARLTLRTRLGLWSPDNPELHEIVIEAGNDTISDRIGLRTVTVSDAQVLLNGRRIFLKGVSAHEESLARGGRSFGPDDARQTLALVKALNGNFIRLAHYPHDEATTRLADELGIMVWAELPVYWGIAWGNPGTLESAKAQAKEMVGRDRNRASVVLWSISNETPQTPARLAFLTELAQTIRKLDNTRPLTAALFGDPRGFVGRLARVVAARRLQESDASPSEKTQLSAFLARVLNKPEPINDPAVISELASTPLGIVVDDPLGDVIDVIGFNQYLGWYYEAPVARALGIDEAVVRRLSLDLLPSITIRARLEKPVMISEFGADAKSGVRGPKTQVFSEDFQADYYHRQLIMIGKIPNLVGVSPWVLKDFRAPRRSLPRLQEFWNRKGLVDETGRRKLAFDVLATAYGADDPYGLTT